MKNNIYALNVFNELLKLIEQDETQEMMTFYQSINSCDNNYSGIHKWLLKE